MLTEILFIFADCQVTDFSVFPILVSKLPRKSYLDHSDFCNKAYHAAFTYKMLCQSLLKSITGFISMISSNLKESVSTDATLLLTDFSIAHDKWQHIFCQEENN